MRTAVRGVSGLGYDGNERVSICPAGDDNRFRLQVNASPIVAFDTNETKLMAHLPLLAVPDPSFFHGSGDRFTVRNFLGQTDVGDHSYVPHDSDVRRHNR